MSQKYKPKRGVLKNLRMFTVEKNQTEAEDLLGFTAGRLTFLETGRVGLDLDELTSICTHYKTDPKTVLTEESYKVLLDNLISIAQVIGAKVDFGGIS